MYLYLKFKEVLYTVTNIGIHKLRILCKHLGALYSHFSKKKIITKVNSVNVRLLLENMLENMYVQR